MFRLVQNVGMGLLMQGTREWRDYSLTAAVTPHLVKRAGIAARVQGLTRFFGLLLAPGNRVQLVRMLHDEEVLAEADFEWNLGETCELTLQVDGDRLLGIVDGSALIQVTDDALDCGVVGLVIEEGRLGIDRVEVPPSSDAWPTPIPCRAGRRRRTRPGWASRSAAGFPGRARRPRRRSRRGAAGGQRRRRPRRS